MNRLRLSLGINLSTKYAHAESIHAARMKKPRKSCFANGMQIRVWECIVKMSLYQVENPEIKLYKCRESQVVRVQCATISLTKISGCADVKS